MARLLGAITDAIPSLFGVCSVIREQLYRFLCTLQRTLLRVLPGLVATFLELVFVLQSSVNRLLNGSRVIGCILEKRPLIRHLQIQFVKHHGQSFLPLQVDPIQKRLLRFRNLVGAVPRSFFLESPVQMLANVTVDNANGWRSKFSGKARCYTR